jgi:hypothetical protein
MEVVGTKKNWHHLKVKKKATHIFVLYSEVVTKKISRLYTEAHLCIATVIIIVSHGVFNMFFTIDEILYIL